MKSLIKSSFGFGSGKSKNNNDKAVDKVDKNNNFQFDEASVSSYIDLLEEAVKHKTGPKIELGIQIVSGKSVTGVVDSFTSRTLKIDDLSQLNSNTLWSALVKILEVSSPILSDANCINLQTASARQVGGITKTLPLHNQQLLGALFATCEILIQNDQSCGHVLVNSLSDALIWSLSPGSSNCRESFCNLISNHREHLPYSQTFSVRLGEDPQTFNLTVWLRIISTPDKPADNSAGRVEELDSQSVSSVGTTESQAKKKHGLIHGTGFKKALGLKKSDSGVQNASGSAAASSTVATTSAAVDINDNASVSSLGTAGTTDSQAAKKKGLIRGTGFKAMMGLKKKKPEEVKAAGIALAPPHTVGGADPQSGLDSSRDRTASDEVLTKQKSASNLLTDTSNNSNNTSNPKLAGLYKPDTASVYKSLDLHVIDNAHNTSERKEQENDHDHSDPKNEFGEGTGRSSDKLPVTSRGGKPPTPTKQSKSITNHPILSKSQTQQGGSNNSSGSAAQYNNNSWITAAGASKKKASPSSSYDEDDHRKPKNSTSSNNIKQTSSGGGSWGTNNRHNNNNRNDNHDSDSENSLQTDPGEEEEEGKEEGKGSDIDGIPTLHSDNELDIDDDEEEDNKAISLRDVQEVFSSSLVSSVSLEYLSLKTLREDEDYADIKNLSRNLKWTLDAIKLSQQVLDLEGTPEQRKGIVSWSDFLLVASPHLHSADRAFLKSNKIAYDQPYKRAGSDGANNRSSAPLSKQPSKVMNNTSTAFLGKQNSTNTFRNINRNESKTSDRGAQSDSDEDAFPSQANKDARSRFKAHNTDNQAFSNSSVQYAGGDNDIDDSLDDIPMLSIAGKKPSNTSNNNLTRSESKRGDDSGIGRFGNNQSAHTIGNDIMETFDSDSDQSDAKRGGKKPSAGGAGEESDLDDSFAGIGSKGVKSSQQQHKRKPTVKKWDARNSSDNDDAVDDSILSIPDISDSPARGRGAAGGGLERPKVIASSPDRVMKGAPSFSNTRSVSFNKNSYSNYNSTDLSKQLSRSLLTDDSDEQRDQDAVPSLNETNSWDEGDSEITDSNKIKSSTNKKKSTSNSYNPNDRSTDSIVSDRVEELSDNDLEDDDHVDPNISELLGGKASSMPISRNDGGSTLLRANSSSTGSSVPMTKRTPAPTNKPKSMFSLTEVDRSKDSIDSTQLSRDEQEEEGAEVDGEREEDGKHNETEENEVQQQQFSTISLDSPLPLKTGSNAAGLTSDTASVTSTDSKTKKKGWGFKSALGLKKKSDASAVTTAPTASRPAGPQRSASSNTVDDTASLAGSVGTAATTESQQLAKKKHSGLFHGTGLKSALGLKKKKPDEATTTPASTAATAATTTIAAGSEVPSDKQQQPLQLQKDADNDNASVSSLGTAVTTDSQAAKKKHGLIHGTGFKAMMGLKKKKPEEGATPVSPSLNSLAQPVTPADGVDQDAFDASSVADSIATTESQQIKKKHGLIRGTGLKSVLGLKKKKPEGAESPASAPTGGSNNAATPDVDETGSVADSVGTAATTDSQAKKKHGLIHGTGFKAMMGLKKKPEESTVASATTTAAAATVLTTTPVESVPSKALPVPATSPQTTRGKGSKPQDTTRSSSSDPSVRKSAMKSSDNSASTAVSAPVASTSSPPRSRSAPAKSRPGESKSTDVPVPSVTAGDGNAGDDNTSVADSVGTAATTDSQVAAKKKGLIRGTGLKKALGLKKKTDEVVAAPTGTAAVTSGHATTSVEKKDADNDNASVSSLGTAVTTDSQAAKKKHGLIHGTGFKAMMGLKKKKPEEPEAPAAPSLNSLAQPVTPGGGNSSDVADETGSVADSVGTAATTDSQAKKKHGLIHGTGFKKALGLKKKDPVDASPTTSAQQPSTGATAQSDDNASVAESVGSAGTTDSQAIKKYGLIHGTGFKKALGLKKKSDQQPSTGADDQSDTSSVADSVATTESQAKKKHGLIHGTGFKKALGLKKKDSAQGVDSSPDLKIPPPITVDNSSNSSMPPPSSSTTPTNKLTNPALRKSTGGSGFGSSFGRALGRPGPASRSNSFSGTSGDEGNGGVALQGSTVNPAGKTSSGLSIVPPGSQMQDKTSPEYLAHRALPKTPVVTAARSTSNTSIVSTKGQVVPPSNGRGLAALLRGNVPAPLKPFSAAGHFTDSRPADRLDNVLGEVNIVQETETAQHVRLRKALERNKQFSETIKQHNQKHHHHMKHKKARAADSDDKTIDKNDRVAGFVSEMKSIQAHAHERQGLRTFASFEAKEDAASRAEWAALIQRREPENLFLSPADMQEMRDLVKLHGKKVVDSGTADTGTDVAAADVVHSGINKHQKQKIQHKEPTPFEIMLSRQLSSTKVLQPDFSRQVFDPSSSTAGPGGVFVPPPIATHSKPLNTEFEMAMGIKHAGPLFKKASNSKTGKGYRTRYFVLIVEPKANPNLKWLLEEGSGNTVPGNGSATPGTTAVTADAASGESKEAATNNRSSMTGGSVDLHKHKSSKAVTASAEKSDLAASVSSLAVSTKHSTTTDKQQHNDNKQQHASNIASNAIAAQSALDPQELNYYLQEYKRSVPSLWGELPMALKRSYCLDNMIGIVTDSAKSKKGMKFRISFRLPENGSVGTGLGHPGGVRVMRGGVSAKDLDPDDDSSEEGESDSDDSDGEGDDSSVGASVGSSASCEADYEVLRVASEDTCDKDFDVLSLSTDGTANKAVATGAEASSSTKAKDNKSEKVAGKAAEGGKSHKGGKTPKSPATVDTAKASTASKKEKKPHSSSAAGIADLNSAYSGLDSAPEDHATAPDHSPSSDITAATAAAAPDNTVLPPKINKRDKTMVHLKLRAQSSDERLQWVKILQSVAAHKEALYVNTISY